MIVIGADKRADGDEPFPPGRLSTTTDLPQRAASRSANSRASISVALPGPNGTMNLTVRCGQGCTGACARNGVAAKPPRRASANSIEHPKWAMMQLIGYALPVPGDVAVIVVSNFSNIRACSLGSALFSRMRLFRTMAACISPTLTRQGNTRLTKLDVRQRRLATISWLR